MYKQHADIDKVRAIGRALARARRQRELTQADLSLLVRTHRTLISQFESGVLPARLRTLREYVRALDAGIQPVIDALLKDALPALRVANPRLAADIEDQIAGAA